MSRRPMRETMSKAALDVIGVPLHLRNKTLDDFQTYNMKSLKRVKSFVADYTSDIDARFDENSGLFFYGSNGVGKTFLASMIVMEAYKWRYRTKRVTFAQYIQVYTRVWDAKTTDQREEAESDLYTEYTGVDFLCLEEIGKEIDSKIAAPILESLLRYREDKALPTIICANLDIDAVEERYGMSVVSLIKGNMTPIMIEGEDKRRNYFVSRTTSKN